MSAKFPSKIKLEESVLRVLGAMNEPITSKAIDDAVTVDLNLTEEITGAIHSGNRTELAYRLAWVRTSLKKKELIQKNSSGWLVVSPE